MPVGRQASGDKLVWCAAARIIERVPFIRTVSQSVSRIYVRTRDESFGLSLPVRARCRPATVSLNLRTDFAFSTATSSPGMLVPLCAVH